jgi:hypothetical protein
LACVAYSAAAAKRQAISMTTAPAIQKSSGDIKEEIIGRHRGSGATKVASPGTWSREGPDWFNLARAIRQKISPWAAVVFSGLIPGFVSDGGRGVRSTSLISLTFLWWHEVTHISPTRALVTNHQARARNSAAPACATSGVGLARWAMSALRRHLRARGLGVMREAGRGGLASVNRIYLVGAVYDLLPE